MKRTQKNLFIIASLLLVQFGLLSQTNAKLNPYSKNAWKNPTIKKAKLIASLDSRFSVIEKNSTHFFGARAGAEIYGRVRFGAGFYFTNKPVLAQNQAWSHYPNQIFHSATRFYYFALFAELVALHKKHFEIAIPNYLGFGWANEKFYSKEGDKYFGKNRDKLALLEVSVLFTYRSCRWFGVGLGFGYRGILNKNKLLKDSYNGPITLLRYKFYLGELYKTIENRIRLNKGLEPKYY